MGSTGSHDQNFLLLLNTWIENIIVMVIQDFKLVLGFFQSGLFHDDLFPDTAAPTPSMTTEEWLNGQNEAPILVSLKV